MEARGTKKSAIGDYISRYNTLTPKINFPLDEPTQAQITKLAGDINKDRVERQRGTVNFSDDSKIKFIKTVKTLYRQFIKKPGEGYIDEVDGKRLVDDFKPQTKKEKDEDEDQIDLNEIPKPKKSCLRRKITA